MPVFHDMFSRSGIPSLMQNFAESVVYRNGTTGSTQLVSAVVIREGMSEDSRGDMSEMFQLHIAISELGSVNPKVDQFSFARRPGDTATWQTVQDIPSIDEGMMVLTLR